MKGQPSRPVREGGVGKVPPAMVVTRWLPTSLFGPVSVRSLKEDCFRRVTAGKLPEAELFFADEVFKASSAILNTRAPFHG